MQRKKYLNLHIHCLWRQSLHLRDPYKASFPSIRAVWTQHVNFSALILALTFSCPVLIHSILGEETQTGAHPFISEPVKPEWRGNAADFNSKTPHFSHDAQREWCNFVRLVQAIYFFVVFLSFGNIANKAKKKKYIHVCFNLTWWHHTISWCGYDGQQNEPLLLQVNCKDT